MKLPDGHTSEDREAARLFARLFKWARKLGADNEFATELAADAYAESLSRGVAEWHYASVVLKHSFLQIKRDRKRRNEDYAWTYRPGSDTPMELQKLATPPMQEKAIELKDVLRRIDQLREPYRTALLLAGLEYTADEIASEMSAAVKDVYWWLQYARKTLRGHDPEGDVAKRGHSRFHGVRRDHHRWSAAFRHKGKYYHCGYHATAEDAAWAYDETASVVLGAAAKLNFPVAA